jgi:hypothetical protein
MGGTQSAQHSSVDLAVTMSVALQCVVFLPMCHSSLATCITFCLQYVLYFYLHIIVASYNIYIAFCSLALRVYVTF